MTAHPSRARPYPPCVESDGYVSYGEMLNFFSSMIFRIVAQRIFDKHFRLQSLDFLGISDTFVVNVVGRNAKN